MLRAWILHVLHRARPSLAHPKFHSLARPHSLAHPVSKMSLTCAPSSSLILEIITALSSLFGVGCGGAGGTITLMFLCTHRHRNLIIFPALVQTQALLFHDQLPNVTDVTGGVGLAGVGWDNNVHVPVHTKAQQPHHFSRCPADTGTALS